MKSYDIISSVLSSISKFANYTNANYLLLKSLYGENKVVYLATLPYLHNTICSSSHHSVNVIEIYIECA